MDVNNLEVPHPTTVSSVFNDDHTNTNEGIYDTNLPQPIPRDASDPYLTLISVYTPDTAPKVQVNFPSSTSSAESRSSRLYSLFKVPIRENLSISPPDTPLLQTADGTVSDQKLNTTKPIVDQSKKRKQDRTDRFISFVRYLFCQFVSIGSNATVSPAINTPAIEETPISPTVQPKVNLHFHLLIMNLNIF